MLAQRLKVALAIIVVGVFFVTLGGWAYTIFVAAILAVCAWEYWRMFTRGGYSPAAWILIPGVSLLALIRHVWSFQYSDALLVLLVLVSMAYHTLHCKDGIKTPAADFAITIAGLLYIGWLGSYLISLRDLPTGQWWILLAIPAIGLGDAGAFFIGTRFGKTPLAPHVSPKKTVEGYWGGVLFSTLGGALLGFLWGLRVPTFTVWQGLILGFILGVLTPLGDLGESMLKRQFDVKDMSNIFPGHGGMLDRIDTWLWGAALSYYLILWLW